MQFLNRYNTVYNLEYINSSLIAFYPNSLKQIVSSMIILFCVQSAEIWDTQSTFKADLSITYFWGINNAPYPIHLNTAFMSFVNRLLDKPCFTSLLILKASSMFCKTKLCNLHSLIFEFIKNSSLNMTSILASTSRNTRYFVHSKI